MPSPKLRGPALVSLLLSTTLGVAACAGIPSTHQIPVALDCESLIPPSYRKPVAPTPLPGLDATAGSIWSSLDDQTSRLDQSNGRTADLVAIAHACQVQQAKVTDAVLKRQRPWYAKWLP